MDADDIFVKTAKGSEEVATRALRLEFRKRTALILVDGRSTVEILQTRIPGDGFLLLEELWRDGFIENVNGEAPLSAVPADTSRAADALPFNLEAAKTAASRMIDALLGPEGESMAIALERTKSAAEFSARAERTRDLIKQMRGAAAATKFWTATSL